MIIAPSFLNLQVNIVAIVCLFRQLITFNKIELCISSTVLFTAISAVYTYVYTVY